MNPSVKKKAREKGCEKKSSIISQLRTSYVHITPQSSNSYT